jgi:hypothetical protein
VSNTCIGSNSKTNLLQSQDVDHSEFAAKHCALNLNTGCLASEPERNRLVPTIDPSLKLTPRFGNASNLADFIKRRSERRKHFIRYIFGGQRFENVLIG